MYDIITVGSSTVDVFARTEFIEEIKIRSKKEVTNLLAYPIGSKILVKELNFTTGGGGTNTAVSFARLGDKVAWLGVLGDDENANFIIRDLKKENVDVLAYKEKGTSGYSVILDSLEHDRTILAYKGVNNCFSYNKVNLKKLKAKWFYFSSMMGDAFDSLVKLAKFAEKNKIKISFNTSEYLAKKGANYLKEILKRTDIFILNYEEAGHIIPNHDIKARLEGLHKLGPKIVVITNGHKDVNCYDGNFLYIGKPHDVKVVETTGAGDAFASSFLAGMIKKNSIEFAIKLGIINSESVISHHGAKTKLLRWNEALSMLKKSPVTVTKKKF